MTGVNEATATPNEMSQAEFAKLRGVKPPLVTRWKQRGLLVMTADGSRVRVAESQAMLQSTLHPGRGGDRTGRNAPPADAPVATDRQGYSFEAAREKRASAQLKELELAERAKQLLDADAVRDATMRRAQVAKAALMKLPRRMAPALSLEGDPAAVERLLLAEIRAICAALATGVEYPAAENPTEEAAA